ncbi:FAD/NAD(P)-binding domain-containing protein [Cadophora sp. DSE1049]|nr:FAD/NAD(P)-binding domain-containing protein [Cadophora sp. DSE1049]
MANSEEPFIAIIGGGLAGLTLSIGLTRQGIPHKIYEAAVAFSEIGAGISLGPNSITALELIDPRIRDALKKCITYNEGIDGSSKPARACVHRAKFLNEFVKLVPSSMTEFGKSLVSICEAACSSQLCLTFADGSTSQASAVIACDGIRSVARQQYVLAGIEDQRICRPAFTNDFVYRGMFPRAKFLEISSNAIDAGKGTVFCGQNSYVIAYPVDKGELINVVAAKHIKSPSADTLAQHESNWTQAVTKEEMLADFENWGAPLKNILSHIERPERWALYDHLPAPTYVKGRVALMGDAAHATTPHQGQGAGMGFEDSFILSSILGEMLNESEPNSVKSDSEMPEDQIRNAKIEACFRAYDEVRRKRTQEVTRTSREAMQIWGFSGDGIGRDLEKMKKSLDGRMKWMWEVDLVSEVKRGVELVRKNLEVGVGV